jgi:hypothetical protein
MVAIAIAGGMCYIANGANAVYAIVKTNATQVMHADVIKLIAVETSRVMHKIASAGTMVTKAGGVDFAGTGIVITVTAAVNIATASVVTATGAEAGAPGGGIFPAVIAIRVVVTAD